MKRDAIFLLAFIIGAVVSGCTKGNPSVSPEWGDCIRFETAEPETTGPLETKASEYTTSSLVSNGFKVSLYNTTNSTAIATNGTASYSSSYFILSGVYWPKTDAVNAYAVYPTSYTISRSGATHSIAVGSSGSSFPGSADLIVAKAYGQTNAGCSGVIPLTFEHPLAYVGSAEIKLDKAMDKLQVKVNSVTVSGPQYGTLTLSTTSSGSDSWSRTGTQTKTVCNTAKTVSSASYSSLTVTGTMFIPTSDNKHTVTVNYDLLQNGVTISSGNSQSCSVTLAAGVKTNLQLIYNVTASALTFSTTISPWVDGTGYNANL